MAAAGSKCPSKQCPSSRAPARLPYLPKARLAALGSWAASGQLGTPRGEAQPLRGQPWPRLLERAAFKVADSAALDHTGGGSLDFKELQRALRSDPPPAAKGGFDKVAKMSSAAKAMKAMKK